MIDSYKKYIEYIEADREALFETKKRTGPLDDIWKWEKLLRKVEYLKNVQGHKMIGRIFYAIFRFKLHRDSVRLGFSIPLNVCGSIPLNVCGKGLSIAHYGSVAINPRASIGENCIIYGDVVIGVQNPGGGHQLLEIMF